ncbi:MAG: peptidoglycan-binding domain-containing protein [bacterium]|nr:peptidoglycan-binding domain-containing protein [bacterium]
MLIKFVYTFIKTKKKILIAGALALGLFVGVQSASAFTAQEIEMLITLLNLDSSKAATLRAMVSSAPVAPAFTFTRNLTIGSTGADVTVLQTQLGVSPATGYFGPITKAAVVAYQAANGISPTSGYVGPLTLAKLNYVAPVVTTTTTTTTTTTDTTTVTTLEGTDGSISDVDKLSQYSSEEVGDGESDVKIAGFEVESSVDGDISLRSIKLIFTGSSNTGSTKLTDYVDTVSIWKGSTKVGSADTSDFNKDSTGVYSKTITLSNPSNPIVKSDTKEKFYVTVDAVSNLDSGDIAGSADAWTVNIANIRYEDGSGVVTTDSDTGDLTTVLDAIPMSFVSFSTAANTELKISTDSSSPDTAIVMVDDTNDTEDVLLLVGKMKLDGTSDAVLNELPITITTNATTTAGVTGTLRLVIDGKEFSKSVSGASVSETITFDNLDLTIGAGDTVTFKVLADVNDIDTATFDEGDYLVASLSSTNRVNIDVENEEGDQLAASEKTGTATGDAQEFRTNGIALTLISTNTSVAAGTGASDDQGTFVIKFKVTAIGDAAYVSSLADSALSGTANTGATALVDRAGTATVGGVSVTITNVTDTDLTSVGNYMIEDGESETFEMTTTVQLPTAGAGGQFRTALGGIDWSTSDEAVPANTYTSNLDSFKTSYIGLN